MLDKLKGKYYKFDEQIKIYGTFKAKLSGEEKYNFIDSLISGSDFWGYFELITTITYELVDDSDKYLRLLERINSKIKNDMAQGPFFNMLIDIGSNKPIFALKLYDKIMTQSKDDDLKVVSGLILGGYGTAHKDFLETYLEDEIDYPKTNSLLKAILVIYENQEMPDKIYSFFDRLFKAEKIDVLREYSNLCIVFINKNHSYFYNHISNLIQKNDKIISYTIFHRLTFQDILDEEKIFHLVSLSLDSDDVVVDTILEVLRKYPFNYVQISQWLIYWINRGVDIRLRNFEWILESLAKKNNCFIDYFIDNFRQIKKSPNSKDYILVLPHLFRELSKNDSKHAFLKISNLNLNDDDEKYLFFRLTEIIIGNIYQDEKNKPLLEHICDKLISLASTRVFVTCNTKWYDKHKNKTSFSREDYDNLIDFAHELLNQLVTKKDAYNFSLIKNNIRKYPNVFIYAETVLNEAEKGKKYTPLMWLGESEEPELNLNILNKKEACLNELFVQQFNLSKFWPKAYLLELNNNLKIFESKPNEKFSKYQQKKHIIDRLSDEKSFWSFISELDFISKFSCDVINVLEPQVPHKPENHLDLKITLFNRSIFFEITRPLLDRKLELDNGAVGLGNKGFSILNTKFRQLFSKETLNEINRGEVKDLYFIVIDISESTIDEHQLLNSFLGSLAYTWQIDKTNGHVVNEFMIRQKDSLSDKYKNTDILSGAIYFKRELIFIDNQPKIKLVGDIIINPKAKNKLSDLEVEELKKMIFR